MDQASRDLEQHDREKALRAKRMARIEATFEEETQKIMALQMKIRRGQLAMARTAMKKHSALCLQAVYRGYRGRLFVRRLRSAGTICAWLYRVFMARVRKQVAIMCFRHISRRALAAVLQHRIKIYKAAVLIQTAYRTYYYRRKYIRQSLIIHMTHSVWTHVVLYGSRRAMLPLSAHLRMQRALYRLLQYYTRMRRLKRLRSMDQVSLFGRIEKSSPELFAFIKGRAIAMENSNSSILTLINTPKATFAAMRAKAVGSKNIYRRAQLQFPKIAELKNELKPWTPSALSFFPPETTGTYRIKRMEEAVTFIYDLVMLARNNLISIMKPEEYAEFARSGMFRSDSNSSVSSDISSGSNQSPSSRSMSRRREVYSGNSNGKPFEGESSRSHHSGPGQKHGRGNHGQKRSSKVISPIPISDLHHISDIPEDGNPATSSDSDDGSDNSHDKRVPNSSLPIVKGRNQNDGRTSFIGAPLPSKQGPVDSLASKTPPPGNKSSFDKPMHRGRKVVPATSKHGPTKNRRLNK